MHWILEKRGALIPKRGDRPGRRFQPKGGWGGRRVKGSGKKAEVLLHPDARESQESYVVMSAAKCAEALSDLEEEAGSADGNADGSALSAAKVPAAEDGSADDADSSAPTAVPLQILAEMPVLV